MWMEITTAPFDRQIGIGVRDADGMHALVFPCRRIAGGWVNAQSGLRLDVSPTHWREWSAEVSSSAPAAR